MTFFIIIEYYKRVNHSSYNNKLCLNSQKKNNKNNQDKSKINRVIITKIIKKPKKALNLIKKVNSNVINCLILTLIAIKNLIKIMIMEKKAVIVKVKYVSCVKNLQKSCHLEKINQK